MNFQAQIVWLCRRWICSDILPIYFQLMAYILTDFGRVSNAPSFQLMEACDDSDFWNNTSTEDSSGKADPGKEDRDRKVQCTGGENSVGLEDDAEEVKVEVGEAVETSENEKEDSGNEAGTHPTGGGEMIEVGDVVLKAEVDADPMGEMGGMAQTGEKPLQRSSEPREMGRERGGRIASASHLDDRYDDFTSGIRMRLRRSKEIITREKSKLVQIDVQRAKKSEGAKTAAELTEKRKEEVEATDADLKENQEVLKRAEEEFAKLREDFELQNEQRKEVVREALKRKEERIALWEACEPMAKRLCEELDTLKEEEMISTDTLKEEMTIERNSMVLLTQMDVFYPRLSESLRVRENARVV